MSGSAPAISRLAPARPRHLAVSRLSFADGAQTTLYVASHARASTSVELVRLPRPEPLAAWCARHGVHEALIGGFFVRAQGTPLGELRTRGVRRRSVPFTAPWDARRACVHAAGGRPVIARRDELPTAPRGDLLQAGPLLVAGGASTVRDGEDPEGFSAASDQFDSDVTAGRYPRAALALTRDAILAVACDGRARTDAGLTLGELAGALVALGAESALNLDGGGSASLVCGGALRNVPRAEWEQPLALGRPVVTALVFREDS